MPRLPLLSIQSLLSTILRVMPYSMLSIFIFIVVRFGSSRLGDSERAVTF
jgi:hypothetical protein